MLTHNEQTLIRVLTQLSPDVEFSTEDHLELSMVVWNTIYNSLTDDNPGGQIVPITQHTDLAAQIIPVDWAWIGRGGGHTRARGTVLHPDQSQRLFTYEAQSVALALCAAAIDAHAWIRDNQRRSN